jgi:non-ribosomal peptide synthetase component F
VCDRFRIPLERLNLPTDHPRGQQLSLLTSTVALRLSPELTDAVRRFARQLGVTLFMAALTALNALLHTATEAEDIRVGTLTANRTAATDDLVGLFLNTLVLCVDLGGDPTMRELLARTRAAALDAYTHQDVPFELVLRRLKAEDPRSASALFTVMLVVDSAPAQVLDVPGVSATAMDGGRAAGPAFTATSCDLVFVLKERRERLELLATYKLDLFRRGTVEALLDGFQEILGAMVRHPDERLNRLKSAYSRPRGGERDASR